VDSRRGAQTGGESLGVLRRRPGVERRSGHVADGTQPAPHRL